MTITYPDPLPFKLRALRNLTDVLKEITPGNGYYSDLADFEAADGATVARVYRGRAWFGEDDPLPLVSILEAVSPADEVAAPPANTPTSEVWWQLLVQGFVSDDAQNPTDPAYLLLADVRQRLAVEAKRKLNSDSHESNILGLGLGQAGKNRIVDLRVGPGVVRPADDVSARAYFWLSLDLRIVDNASAPYGV